MPRVAAHRCRAVKLHLAEARSGPRQRLQGICSSMMLAKSLLWIAFFLTGTHILDFFWPNLIHIGFRSPKFEIFLANFCSIYLHLPRFVVSWGIPESLLYHVFTQYTPELPGEWSPNAVLVPYILFVERWGKHDFSNLARFSSTVTYLGLIDRQQKMSNIVVSLDVYF